ncbi:MAG: DUF2786 domain-containing protein [Acidimicrobiia bacterium]|nr:DUF2786 domain-containing protein [Acidimicrobiia bacterium]
MTKENERVLQRVRALLAKAESTTFAEEAASLTAKAHELIAAHAIDLAILEEKTGRGSIVSRMIFIEAPYPKEKFLLLSAAARANNADSLLGLGRRGFELLREEDRLDEIDASGSFAWIIGYESDLESVELLFTSLLLQAVNVMLNAGSRTDWSGTNRTKSFRRSFLIGFADVIDTRLRETLRATSAAADEARGGSVLPVLKSRREEVRQELLERFPDTKTLRTSVSNYDGIQAGVHAGQQADIGTSRLRGKQRALRGR